MISAFAPDRYVSWEAHINGMPVRQTEDFVGYVDFQVFKCFMTAEDEKAAALEKELQADYMAGTNDEDGLLEVIRRFVPADGA